MVNPGTRKIDALLFDKDGTLFDFHASWSGWTHDLIESLTEHDPAARQRLAKHMQFDLTARRFLPTSPIIAGTNREAAQCVVAALPERNLAQTEQLLMETAARVPQVEAVPLGPFLDGLAAEGLALGVMTNDTEFAARAQLQQAGIEDRFRFIAGFDSGHGAKPLPDPLLAFAKALGVPPARVAMVGDSTHDMFAGRAAGMQTIAVLTGTATASDLAPHADVVLPDIGHIPAWLHS